MRPATEDWTAFFHITPSANNAELVGRLDHAITDHEYLPTVWVAVASVQEQVQIGASNFQAETTHCGGECTRRWPRLRAAAEAGLGVMVENRALLLECQLAP